MENKFSAAMKLYYETIAPGTEREYTRHLSRFAAFLKKRPLSAANKTDALKYHSYVKTLKSYFDGEPLADRTVQATFRALNSQYRFAMEYGIIASNPFVLVNRRLARKLPYDKRKRIIPDFLSIRPKIEALTNRVGKYKWKGFQIAALFAVFYGCGPRMSELRSIKLDEVFEDRGYLRIHVPRSKTRKARNLTLPEWARAIVEKWLTNRPTALPGPWLFPSNYGTRTGEQLTEIAVYDLHRRYFGGGCHMARRTFISYLLHADCEPMEIAKDSGHTDPRMIMLYDLRPDNPKNAASLNSTYTLEN
jgi:integrase